MMFDLLPDRTWLWLATAVYAAAILISTVSMLREHVRPHRLMVALLSTGLLLQTIGLYQRGMGAGGCPVRNTFEVVQFVVWCVLLLYLVVGTSFRISLLGYFTSGLAILLSVVSLSVHAWDGPAGPPVFGGNPWIEMHASLGLLAYGAFGTLALTSLMFLLQTFSLKRKKLRGLFAFLPPIVNLEVMNFRLLVTGLAVLTVSILLGGHYYRQDPDAVSGTKLVFTIGVWCAYLLVLALRSRRLLVSNALAWSCLAMFGVALVSLGPISASRDHHHPDTSTGAHAPPRP